MGLRMMSVACVQCGRKAGILRGGWKQLKMRDVRNDAAQTDLGENLTFFPAPQIPGWESLSKREKLRTFFSEHEPQVRDMKKPRETETVWLCPRCGAADQRIERSSVEAQTVQTA